MKAGIGFVKEADGSLPDQAIIAGMLLFRREKKHGCKHTAHVRDRQVRDGTTPPPPYGNNQRGASVVNHPWENSCVCCKKNL